MSSRHNQETTGSSPVVIDNGSDTIKAGLVLEKTPCLVVPTVVGHQIQACRTFVGYEAQSECRVLERPIERGIIQDWDQMETIWEHIYSELGVFSTDQPLLLADGLENIVSGRMKMAQVFFETFNVPSIFINSQAAFSMYAGGQSSGISVDSGHSTTRVIYVYQGWAMPSTQTVDTIAGTLVSRQLEDLLKQKPALRDGLPSGVLQHIKERLCYTSLDFQTDDRQYNHTMEESFELPDGQVIKLGKERFRAPEALFNPGIFDPHWAGRPGIPGAVIATIMKSDEDLRRRLFRQIVLSGGNSMLPGFAARLEKEVAFAAPASAKVEVVANHARKYDAWVGGTLMGETSTLPLVSVTRQEYDETGPSITKRKFL